MPVGQPARHIQHHRHGEQVASGQGLSGILDQQSTRRRLGIAGAVAGLIILASCAVIPFAGTALPVIIPFIPIFETTVILVEGLTAFFLAIQFRAMRQPYLGGLAGAYGFVIIMAGIQLLIFPGVFSPAGLLHAGPQSAVWLWVFWHGGFPAMVVLALLARTPAATRHLGPALPSLGIALMIAGPLIAGLLAWLAVAHAQWLPALVKNGSYHFLREGLTAKIVITSQLLAIATCIRITRLRDLLSLWVVVALLASLGDALIVLAAGARYSLGWYAGRLLSVVSSSVVLCVLIFEFTRAYERLVAANHLLTERAMHDGLTGAFNRFYFSEQFSREFRRAVRERAPVSVLMIDVDHFKAYNDHCGHHEGDQCLIAITRALQGALRRPGDFVARYGGEEFVVVLPRTGSEGAIALAETMRRAVIALALTRRNDANDVVTISIGLATIDPAVDDITTDDLVQRADTALYQAKHAGRNRVVALPAQPGAWVLIQSKQGHGGFAPLDPPLRAEPLEPKSGR